MNLRAIDIGTFPEPGGLGYVAWNVWLWVDDPSPQTWGPQTITVSEGGYSVTATATAEQVVWDLGNGDSLTCGRGTPWSDAHVRNEPSPTCGYQYDSAGTYTLTATTQWTVTWSGMGRSGVIPLELTDSTEMLVAEVQAVNTGGR